MSDLKKEFFKGIFEENPAFRLILGLCPTLAVTSSIVNGVGMGLATTFVLICSNGLISILRNVIPAKIRIPAYIVVIASFVTIIDLVMAGFTPQLHQALGIFIPLIVVNCVILGRAEAFANKNGVLVSLIDGLGMGIGFTLSLGLLGLIRELLGSGTMMGVPLFGPNFQPVLIMILPPGGFLALGLLIGYFNYLSSKGN